MKKIAVLFIALALIMSATVVAFAADLPSPLGVASYPPDGAKVDIIPSGKTATVQVSGMEIYKNSIYVYDGKTTQLYKLENGVVVIPVRSWFNMPFKGNDGLWHFLLVVPQHQVMKAPYMGAGIGIMPDFGQGCALTAAEWLPKTAR